MTEFPVADRRHTPSKSLVQVAPPRLRRAASLLASFEPDGIVVINYYAKQRFSCNTLALDMLKWFEEWRTPEELFTHLSQYSAASLADAMAQLLEAGALVAEGTAQARADERFRSEWEWGGIAGLYHFTVRDTPFLTGEAAREHMKERLARRPSPPLYARNDDCDDRTALPRPDLETEPFRTMYRRKSRRQFGFEPIALQDLAACLFAGNGITGFYDIPDYGRLPRTMTPSGGARNPFELYAYAARVQGLQPGFYHYSALDHELGQINSNQPDLPALLGDQAWTSDAAAIIFLVANFDRTSWKYHHPSAYRVVITEGGCIAQNILLAATSCELAAAPTGALSESAIEKALGLKDIPAQSPAFAIALGTPTPDRGANDHHTPLTLQKEED
ncbi:MAG: SagB/ThcOx family dehydrogenase [Gammaproteobacteria bacterium]